MAEQFQVYTNKDFAQPSEKRVLPRFPFAYLFFRTSRNNKDITCHVHDISYEGMQIELMTDESEFRIGQDASGEINWLGETLKVSGKIKWVYQKRAGIEFQLDGPNLNLLKKLLASEAISKQFKPIHEILPKVRPDFELPQDLFLWLRAEGPFEIFAWKKNNEIYRFQILMLNQFVEWRQELDQLTGHIQFRRESELPLTLEKECLFVFDPRPDSALITKAKDLLSQINHRILAQNIQDFFLQKLGK
jgi:hypothetical protein